MDKVIIVLPTYNEAENIEDFLNVVFEKINSMENCTTSILVVDDYSPDGTAEIVKKMQENNQNLFLYMNKNRGLGNAYIAGFKYAIQELDADILIEMDSDFSHDPNKLKELISGIQEGSDFAIGSRYIKGGSIPDNWGILRKLNSKWGNIFARFVAGLYQVKDCTSGYRAIKADYIRKINLDNLDAAGYTFQMNILFEVNKLGGRIVEIPIDFIDRVKGESKLRINDILEFITNSFKLRWRLIRKK